MSRYKRSPGFRDSSSSSGHNENFPKIKNERHNEREIRSLCLSNIPETINDTIVRKLIDQEFCRFGEFQVRIASHLGERVAYLNFTRPTEADDAVKQVKSFEIESKSVFIKPIYVDQNIRRARSRSSVHRSRQVLAHKEPHSYDYEKPVRSISPRYVRKDKFSSDKEATRTLFVGNIAKDIDVELLLHKFGKFGKVQNIDIKRNTQSRSGTIYAFIQFSTAAMAINAKRELNGICLKGSPLLIGYGRQTPSTCIQIEGLGPWVTFEELEKNVLKTGNVSRISWPRNKNHAFIVFQSTYDASNALEALRSMRFSDKRVSAELTDIRNLVDDSLIEKPPIKRRSPSRIVSPVRSRLSLSTAESTSEVCDCLEGVWKGKISLKKNNFGCRFFILRGDESLIGKYLFEDRDHKSKSVPISLNVTQTMAMDPSVMYEINDRLDTVSSSKFCVMFATSYTLSGAAKEDHKTPPKPIKHLIDYLKTKNSSGVIMLPHSAGSSRSTSILHIIPPCDFVFGILRERAPKLIHKSMMEDFVLILLLRHVDNRV